MEKGERAGSDATEPNRAAAIVARAARIYNSVLPSQIFCKETLSLSLSLAMRSTKAARQCCRGRDMTGEMGFEFYSEVKLLKSYFGTNCAVIVAEGGENKGRNFCNMTDEDCSPSANYFCSVVLHPSSYPSIHPFLSLPLFPFNPAYLLDIGRTQARGQLSCLSDLRPRA